MPVIQILTNIVSTARHGVIVRNVTANTDSPENKSYYQLDNRSMEKILMKKLIPLLSALLVTAAIAAIIFTDSNPIQAIEKAPALFGLD